MRARGGELYVVADLDSHLSGGDGIHVTRVSEYAGLLSPVVHVIPLQLLAYHTAVLRGTDVDKPQESGQECDGGVRCAFWLRRRRRHHHRERKQPWLISRWLERPGIDPQSRRRADGV